MLSAEATDSGFSAEFQFAPDLGVFAGHFPSHPLVPGVYLIEAVRCAAESVFDRTFRIVFVTQTKFSRPVAPGDRVRFDVKVASGDDGLECRATILGADTPGGGAELVSKTRLRLH